MNTQPRTLAFPTTVLLCVDLGFLSGAAIAQTAQDLVGTYTFVSAVSLQPDGRRVEPFGPNLKGLYVFDAGGRFVFVMMRPEIPKFASNNQSHAGHA